jgi:uncharacterized Zn-binding protein involved in type VI secretion
MPLAARSTDLASHGIPISSAPGSVTTLVGGLPSLRCGPDFNACPLVIPGVPPIPHVGNVAPMGSTTVLINNMPAARMGDSIPEAGPPNSIAIGAPTVMIG